MNSEYSNSEPIKLSKSLYTILCHKIKYIIENKLIAKGQIVFTPKCTATAHLLSRQMESVRDHKFHSGYTHSLMDRGTLFRTYIRLKSKQREIVVHLKSLRFSQMRSEMRLCLFLQKWLKWSAHFPILNWGRFVFCQFSAKMPKGIYSELTAGRIFPDFPAIIKAFLGSLLCFNCLSIFWAICYKRFKIPNCFLFSQISISV